MASANDPPRQRPARPRWTQFHLRTLLIVIAIGGVGFAVWKHYDARRMRRDALIRECEQHETLDEGLPAWPRFSFAFEGEFTHSDGSLYRVLVFDSAMKSWPGHNPYKIVLASNGYKQLTSGVFGGEEHYSSAALTTRNGKTVISVTCLHRPMRGGVGTYSYEVTPSSIRSVGDVVWDDADYWSRAFAATNLAANPGQPIAQLGGSMAVSPETGEYVSVFIHDNWRGTDTDLIHLRDLPFLETLFLEPRNLTDAGLAHLAGMKHLKTLVLHNTRITDKGLEHLKQIPSLEFVNLNATQVTESGVHALRKALPRLEVSAFRQGWAPGNLIGHKQHEAISELDFRDTQIVDSDVSQFKRLKNLKRLDLRWCGASDEALEAICGLTGLKELHVSGKLISDSGVVHLQQLVHLRELDLSGTRITGEGVRRLSQMSELKVLSLCSTNFGDADLAHLKNLVALEELYLASTAIDGSGFNILGSLPQLKTVHVDHSQINDDGMDCISRLPALEHLRLSNTMVTDAGLAFLSRSVALKELDLRETKVTSAGVRRLEQAIPNCNILRK